ncbi:hypothetical protein L6452_15164 [Arctium lappa]|uniref:Uncharacterized protein n=1 Tax=Arctium lappa TaxID=4217 RepID=A0ACB9CN36_ARCLA|nr:hypothetical protein L6452_15164 [Arctium lappa]
MAMLTMRVKRFIKRTDRNNFAMRREDGAGFDKSKVECYKCHNLGHFARECRGGTSQHHGCNNKQPKSSNYKRNSSQALVSQEESSSTAIPTEKWEKNQLEIELEKSREECEKVKSEFEKAKLDIEKYSNAYKAMDSLLKSQIHDKLKRDSEKENSESKYKEYHKDTPLEDHILTNERWGKPFIKSDKVEMYKTETETVKSEKVETSRKVGYRKQSRKHMAENVKTTPLKSHIQNKFAKSKENTPSKSRSNSHNKKANNFVKIWVPKVKKPVSTATSNSTANRNSATDSNTTANHVSTANKDNAATSVNAAKPIILTKYSIHKIPKSDHLIQTKITDYIYVDMKGQPKTTLAWVPSKN